MREDKFCFWIGICGGVILITLAFWVLGSMTWRSGLAIFITFFAGGFVSAADILIEEFIEKEKARNNK